MDYDYKKRGYLLPAGCKDLVDVLKLPSAKPTAAQPAPSPLPPIIGEIAVAETMTVRELAAALKQRPFKIVAALIELGVMPTGGGQSVSFDMIAQGSSKIWIHRQESGLTPGMRGPCKC